MNIRRPKEGEEPFVNALAKLSPFTRDFSNPPMSLKQMRKDAWPDEVWVATDRRIVGFIWARPMKAKHMPWSTVYYMGVDPDYQGTPSRKKPYIEGTLAEALLEKALTTSPFGELQLVCEDRNERATAFYAKYMDRIATGTVGKDARPYTRWRVTASSSRWK